MGGRGNYIWGMLYEGRIKNKERKVDTVRENWTKATLKLSRANAKFYSSV